MASVREHLREGHLKSAEHFVKRAKFHKAMSGHFGQLAEMAKAQSDLEDSHAVCKAVADEHATMSGECADQAQYHTDCAKDLAAAMKAAMGGADPDALMPWPKGLATVIPDRAGIRSVPRGGQPQPLARASVPVEFENLIKVSDDE